MVRLGGGFRRSRLEGSRPAKGKPLEKSADENKWLAQVPPGSSGGQLERQKFKAAPKPKELPPGYVYARACVPGDKIIAVDDCDDVLLQVIEVSPWMVVCINLATRETLGVLPGVIVEVAA